jgi:hypothetical protein
MRVVLLRRAYIFDICPCRCVAESPTRDISRHRRAFRGQEPLPPPHKNWHDRPPIGPAFIAGSRDNQSMRQLQLFTPAELAGMRDRTASRRYSPEHDTFRREHQRHRAWGLTQRHGERLRRLRTGPCAAAAANTPENRRQIPSQDPSPSPSPAPPDQGQCPAPSRNTPVNRRPAHRRGAQASQAEPASKDQLRPAHARPSRIHQHAEPARRPATTPTRLTPTRPPLPPASPGSDRNAHPVRPGPRRSPRPPQRNYPPPRTKPADIIIDASPRPANHHPNISLKQPEKARGRPQIPAHPFTTQRAKPSFLNRLAACALVGRSVYLPGRQRP